MNDDQFFDRLQRLVASNAEHGQPNDAAQVLAALGTPAASIAVLDNGNIFSKCISTLNHTPDTLFQAASISKTLMGTVTMKLIELGNLSVDAPMHTLLPSSINDSLAPLTSPKRKLLERITIHHLLSHTAGINVTGFEGYTRSESIPTAEQTALGLPPSNSPRFVMSAFPGLDHVYSGGSCTLLQIIIAKVTGLTYAEAVTRHVLEPLNMTRSSYVLAPGESDFAIAHTTGYSKHPADYHILPEHAAAGLWTTPTDLLKLVRAVQESLLDPVESEKTKKAFFPQALARQMLTLVEEDMALAWMAEERVFGHPGGNYPGYMCFFYGFADLPWNAKKDDSKRAQASADEDALPHLSGAAVMTNSWVGSDVINKMHHAIAYLKGWPEWFQDAAGPNANTPWIDYEAEIGERWKEWKGTWEKGWIIAEDESGQPVAGVEADLMMGLKIAATPNEEYEVGGRVEQSIDLVMDGMSFMFRLGWDEEKDERIVEIWKGLAGKEEILRRV